MFNFNLHYLILEQQENPDVPKKDPKGDFNAQLNQILGIKELGEAFQKQFENKIDYSKLYEFFNDNPQKQETKIDGNRYNILGKIKASLLTPDACSLDMVIYPTGGVNADGSLNIILYLSEKKDSDNYLNVSFILNKDGSMKDFSHAYLADDLANGVPDNIVSQDCRRLMGQFTVNDLNSYIETVNMGNSNDPYVKTPSEYKLVEFDGLFKK